MAPIKFAVFFALVLILNFHWVHSQYFGGYGGGFYPGYGGCDNDSDLDVILPFLLIAMCDRGGYGGYGGGYGGYPPIPYAYGGYGGCCGGFGCGCGGCCGGCGCGC